jgi:hypothetical protein
MQGYGEVFARVYNLRWGGFAQRIAPALIMFYGSTEPGQQKKPVLDLCVVPGNWLWLKFQPATKTNHQIHDEIRAAQHSKSDHLGSLSEMVGYALSRRSCFDFLCVSRHKTSAWPNDMERLA